MAWDNTEPPKQPHALERMFDISSRAGCERAMRNGAISLLLVAVVSGYMGSMALWGTPTGSAEFDARLESIRDPWVLIHAVVYAILGLLVYRRSRAAATFAVLYYVALVLVESLSLGRMALNIFRIFLLALLVMAVAASFQWHRLYAAEAASGVQLSQLPTGHAKGGDLSAASTSGFIAMLRFIFGLISAFFVAGTAMSMWSLVEEPGIRSVVSLLHSALMLFAAMSTYQALKISAAKSMRFALLLFALGYVGTAVYRLGFVPGGEGPMVSDLLFFGTPAALVLFRVWQESRGAATG